MRKYFIIVLSLFVLMSGVVFGQDNPKFKIGLVFDVTGRGDKSFNDSAFEGLQEVAQDFNGYFVNEKDAKDYGKDVQIEALTPENSANGRLDGLRKFGKAGYSMVFGVGFDFTNAITMAAKEFPKTQFVLIDGYIPDLKPDDNITIVSFKEQEGSFLVGMIAGLVSKGAKVGFVGGMDMDVIHKFEVGYRAGLIYANPVYKNPGQVLIQYIGKDPSAFANPEKSKALAADMYDQGAQIVYHASGASGLGVFQAASAAKKLAIGVDSDQGAMLANDSDAKIRALSPFVLTSMVKRVNRAVVLLVRDFIRVGKTANRYQSYGLANDCVSYVQNTQNKTIISDEMDKKVIEARFMIGNGKLSVPANRDELASWKSQ